MGDDLGERLVRVGLLTRSALAEALDVAPPHGAAMVRELVSGGLLEDAIAGFFVAEGFGPLLVERDLGVADRAVAERVPTSMAWEFLALPVRDTAAGIVVAMATPSDRHIVTELERALGRGVVATVARASDVERAIRAQRADLEAVLAAAERAAPRRARRDSPPPVLELTRRRGTPAAPAPGASPSGYLARDKAEGAPAAKLGPRVSVLPADGEAEVEAPLLLVRHKAVPRGATPPAGVAPPARAKPHPAEGAPRASAAGERGAERTPTKEYETGEPSREARDVSASAEPSTTIGDAVRRLTPSTPISRPPGSALDAPAPAGTITAEAASRPPSSAAMSSAGRARPGRTTSPGFGREEIVSKSLPARPSGAPVAAGAAKAGAWARASTQPRIAAAGSAGAPATDGATSAPAARAGAGAATTPGPAASERTQARGAAAGPEAAARSAGAPDGGVSPPSGRGSDATPTLAPPPDDGAGDRWDLPGSPAPGSKANKVSSAAVLAPKAVGGDIGPVLAGIRAAKDRDTVVRLACDGAVTVSRAAVFLALRKGVLKGWDGAGQGISRDSVRNLWIPAGSASMFKRVLDEGVAYVGAYGTGIADGLFKAAVGSRGGDVMVQPVLLEQKVVGLLCVDDLRPGPLGRGRIESLANAVGEAFRRIISAGK